MDNLKNLLTNANNMIKIQDVIFEIILRHIKDLIYVMKVENSSFKYVFLNEIALKQAKVTSHCIGKTFHDVLPDDIADHLHHQYSTVLKTKEPYLFEDNIILDNKVIFGESILTPIFDDENKHVNFIVCVTRDITESVLEKQKLYETRQRYKSIIDHNMDVVFSVDLQGYLLQTNPSTFEITGYIESDLVNKSVFTLFHERDREGFFSVFQNTLKGKPDEFLGCRIIHKNGQSLKVHIKTIPIVVDNSVLGIYMIIKDITEQLNAEEMMKYLAFHDQLTGLPNRSSLKKELTEAVINCGNSSQQLVVMYIDLDRFKLLNDTMGHNVGDLLLVEVADRLISIGNNANYSIYRQGGDEFIVVLQNTNPELAIIYANNIVNTLNKPFSFNNQEFFITASIGISLFPVDGLDGETLIKNADTALYIVKDRGRGHFRFYSDQMNQGNSYIMMMETGLRRAITQNELVLFYQPQVNINTEEVNGFEVLLRWNHPTLGLIPPSEFIHLAEESGMIIPIGEWVIKTICEKMRQWKDKKYNQLAMAINLSPRQFQQTGLVDFIKVEILKNNIDPTLLEFEITEGAIRDSKEALTTLIHLKELGVRIAVDDFGTGFSSLSYLKRYPIDTLKIDQSFLKDVLIDKKDQAIITTIIHLAKSLELDVIAEGVEQIEQLQLLKEKQCNKAQGYYFSKPIPEEEVLKQYLKK
ncbi:sensor domain-containing protein [Litchfieldia alkalitelluris]|uniref:sensor domain-containing protein n=1 Tax=Litchfieldia alkalitelluris TaxID=304268 RepID=UPI000998CE80|nr:bifunctional diguanylate cyclase/phosphodiesterase [Litchfieldia alkalitelluris]